jgi:hypothetical protein
LRHRRILELGHPASDSRVSSQDPFPVQLLDADHRSAFEDRRCGPHGSVRRRGPYIQRG